MANKYRVYDVETGLSKPNWKNILSDIGEVAGGILCVIGIGLIAFGMSLF